MRRSVRLQVESLEDRSVPSNTPIVGPIAVDPIVVNPVPIAIVHQMDPLAGQGIGTFVSAPLMVDAGAHYQLNGHGNFGVLGDVSITGSLQGVGFIEHGRATGALTFANSHGSVTIALRGAIQPGFSQIPQWFTFEVISATGQFRHTNLKDHAVIRIDYQWNPVVDPLANGPPHILPLVMGGSFKFAIRPT